ncbi:MAG: aconitase X swivel domain-containing protein [Actinomycetota bacterium]
MATDHPRILVPGTAAGELIVLDEPLSLWGGLGPLTGELIDIHHPQVGQPLAGKVVVMPSGRGSSSSSYVLAEAARTGVAPAAFLLGEPDGIVALGALVASELYGIEVPVVVLDPETYAALATGTRIEVDAARDHDVTLTVVA